MCGGGTIAIEAALIAANTAPGLLRYCSNNTLYWPVSLHWKDINEELQSQEQTSLWNELFQDAVHQDQRPFLKEPFIFANDLLRSSIQLARASAANAGVDHLITFSYQDIVDYYLPTTDSQKRPEKRCTVITNPPWDHRLNAKDHSWDKLNEFLLDSFSEGLERAFVLTGNPALIPKIQMKPWKKRSLNAANTPLELIAYKESQQK